MNGFQKDPLWYIFMGIVIASFCTAIYWRLWPYDPIRIDKFCVDKTVVSRGEEICFVFKGEKLLPLPAHIVVDLVNGETIPIMTYQSNNKVGPILSPRCFIMPSHVKLRKDYRIKWTATYNPNPIRIIIEDGLSDPIEVIDSTNGNQGKQGIQGIQGKPGKDAK
jgi:hypothetical protein